MIVAMVVCMSATAGADVSVSIGVPNVSIGIIMPRFPEMTPVPGYPVYYAPRVDGNYFFYDGVYWVYENDNWFASTWYNGPWAMVSPDDVPLFVLRIPVRYYRQPPAYFRGWQQSAPPRWGQRWGREWENNRRGWDRWKRGSAPAAAPLPVYQRRYSGDRYPRWEQQHPLRNQYYRYQPRDTTVRKQIEQQERRHVEPRNHRGPTDSRPQQQLQQRGPSQQEQRQHPQQRGPSSQEQRQQGQHGRGNDKDDDRRPGR